MKTTIQIGRSVQVIQMGQPECWNKISIEREFPEGVNIQQAIDDLFLEVEAAHEKHSKSFVEPVTLRGKGDLFFNVTTQKEER